MNEKYLNISEINKYIKGLIDKDVTLNRIYVKGEISNFKRHSRGHCYFTLKDETSRISAVMFSFNASKLLFEPKDGDSVLIKGKISVYEPSGNYQVYAEEMSLDGIGDLYIKFEKLKEQLAKEGLFSNLHKKKIPTFPKKIGIITAPTGAAVRDIITTINRRYPLARTVLFPTLVQGDGAKENIVRCIKQADKSDVDTIILGRGGGSIEDLWAFNEEVVARAIFDAKKPIISAVGHEIDFTISDFVADLRAPTPTAAAELAVPNKPDVIKGLNNLKVRISDNLKNMLSNYKEKLNRFESNYILNNPVSMYEIKEQKLDTFIEKINILINQKIEKNKNEFKYASTKLELLNPISILNKGYSITKINNKAIKNITEVKVGDKIETTLSKGLITSKIIEMKEVKK